MKSGASLKRATGRVSPSLVAFQLRQQGLPRSRKILEGEASFSAATSFTPLNLTQSNRIARTVETIDDRKHDNCVVALDLSSVHFTWGEGRKVPGSSTRY